MYLDSSSLYSFDSSIKSFWMQLSTTIALVFSWFFYLCLILLLLWYGLYPLQALGSLSLSHWLWQLTRSSWHAMLCFHLRMHKSLISLFRLQSIRYWFVVLLWLLPSLHWRVFFMPLYSFFSISSASDYSFPSFES